MLLLCQRRWTWKEGKVSNSAIILLKSIKVIVYQQRLKVFLKFQKCVLSRKPSSLFFGSIILNIFICFKGDLFVYYRFRIKELVPLRKPYDRLSRINSTLIEKFLLASFNYFNLLM